MMIRSLNIAILGFVSTVLIGCAGSSTQSTDILSNTNSLGSAAETASKVDQMSLTDSLVSQLGVSETQAQGGAGAIMQYAKDSLSPSEFSSVADAVPGMDSLLSAAPSTSGIGGQAMSAISGASGDLGGAAGLASAFQQLNMSPDMISQFVPVISDYVKNVAGEQTSSVLQSALGSLL